MTVASRASAASVSGGQVGGYAIGQYDALTLRTGISYGFGDADTSRGITAGSFHDAATASQTLDTLQLFGEAGYGFDMDSITLEPFAGLAWTRLNAGAFAVTGASSALSGTARQMDSSFLTLGLNLAPRLPLDFLGNTLTPDMRIGWQRAFNGDTASRTLAFAGGSAFTVFGNPLDRDRAVVDLGATLALKGARATLDYSGALSSHSTEHGVRFSVSAGL